MDTHESLQFVRNFEAFISHAPTNKDAEAYIRNVLSGIANNCPMDVLVKVAECVLDIRKAELKSVGDNN